MSGDNRGRVTADELAWAAEWLDLYEEDPEHADDPTSAGATYARVAVWLRAEADRRDEEAAVRRIAREHRISYRAARHAYRKALANVAGDGATADPG